MRKLLGYSALLLLLLFATACGQAGTNAPEETNTNAPEASNAAAPEASNPNEETDGPSYYGEWTVTKVAGSTPVATAPNEEMIGKSAVYSKEKAVFDQEQIPNPVYEEKELTNEDFIAEYRMPLSAIGIEADSVLTVTVKDWTNPGSHLLEMNADTMLYLWDGNFYELKRKSS